MDSSPQPPSARLTILLGETAHLWTSPLTPQLPEPLLHTAAQVIFPNTSQIILLLCSRSFTEALPTVFKNTTSFPGSCGKSGPAYVLESERLKKVTSLTHQHTSNVNLGKSHNF